MAPRLRRRRDPVLEPPSASSSSEEDDEESEEILLNQKSTDIVTVTGGGESDEVEDVSESDEFAIQDVSTQSKKSHLQDAAAAAAAEAILDLAKPNKPVAASSTRSRKSHLQAAAGTQERKENGKETPKKKDNASNGVEKSGIYWSLDDEIAMLEEMIDYQQTKGGDPLANAASFYDFIKKNLPNDVSKAKMVDKIKGLKKKYQNIVEDPVSTKPHDLYFLELSRKIWGGNVRIANGSPERRKLAVNDGKKQQKNVEGDNDSPITPKVKVKEESEDFWAKYPLLEKSLMSEKLTPLEIPVLEDVHFVKETMSLIGSSKASELERKWKKLKMEELELQVKKLKLIHHQNQLMQEAFKSSS